VSRRMPKKKERGERVRMGSECGWGASADEHRIGLGILKPSVLGRGIEARGPEAS
jgi:hypothetical protein